MHGNARDIRKRIVPASI